MGLKHMQSQVDHDNYVAVCAETWGHLAPKRNASYVGAIRFAVGMYGDDHLNPTPLRCELKTRKGEELDDSPWFYDALIELLQDWAATHHYGGQPLPAHWPKVEAGNVYEWRGTFRNYAFIGELHRMEIIPED